MGMQKPSVFHRLILFRDAQYTVAERIAPLGPYLPAGMALPDEQFERV